MERNSMYATSAPSVRKPVTAPLHWVLRQPRRIAGWFFSGNEALSADPATHKTYLVILASLLILPFFCSVRPDGSGRLSFCGVPLSGACISQQVFRVECPGCGLTRSFVLLTHGCLRDSVHCHRLGIVLYAFFLQQALVRVCVLLRPAMAGQRALAASQHYLALAMIVLIIANWVLGIFCGSNGS